MGLDTDETDLFNFTSGYAQQDGEIRFGPMEGVLRRQAPKFRLHGQDSEYYTYQEYDSETETMITRTQSEKGSGWDFTFRLYNIAAFSTILIDKKPNHDFYVNVKGRIGAGHEQPPGGSAPINNPSQIIMNILRTEYGLSGFSLIDYNGQDLERARSEHSNWHLDFAITEQDEGKKIIQERIG